MTETTGPITLTADDCAAIRGATTYVVRLEGETVTLELTRREKPATRKGYAAREGTSVELTRTIRGSAWTTVRGTFCELYVSGAWQALALIVRPGDVLHLFASDDNSNGYLRAACIPAGAMSEYGHGQGYPRLYLDELCVDVVRKGRRVVDRMVLCHSVCPDNSARAVQPTRRAQRAEDVYREVTA